MTNYFVKQLNNLSTPHTTPQPNEILPPNQKVALGCSDNRVRVIDRRYLIKEPTKRATKRNYLYQFSCGKPDKYEMYRLTCIQYNSTGRKLLASSSSNVVYLFDFDVGLLFLFYFCYLLFFYYLYSFHFYYYR